MLALGRQGGWRIHAAERDAVLLPGPVGVRPKTTSRRRPASVRGPREAPIRGTPASTQNRFARSCVRYVVALLSKGLSPPRVRAAATTNNQLARRMGGRQ